MCACVCSSECCVCSFIENKCLCGIVLLWVCLFSHRNDLKITVHVLMAVDVVIRQLGVIVVCVFVYGNVAVFDALN